MKTIGEKILDRRLSLNLTQQEVADRAGISVRTISKYEKDAVNPRGLNLRRLCDVLGVSVAYLTDPTIDDPRYGLEEAPYVDEIRHSYGNAAAMDMAGLLEANRALFAGGNVPQEDKDLFFQAVMQAYVETKQEAHDRFTPKKFRDESSSV